jgi:small subunit ribosomal protein S28e
MAKGDQKKAQAEQSQSYPGTVETIVGNASSKGGVTQVRVKVLAGRDEGKIITRNVRGPVRVGDTLMMTETEYEARKIMKKSRKGGKM